MPRIRTLTWILTGDGVKSVTGSRVRILVKGVAASPSRFPGTSPGIRGGKMTEPLPPPGRAPAALREAAHYTPRKPNVPDRTLPLEWGKRCIPHRLRHRAPALRLGGAACTDGRPTCPPPPAGAGASSPGLGPAPPLAHVAARQNRPRHPAAAASRVTPRRLWARQRRTRATFPPGLTVPRGGEAFSCRPISRLPGRRQSRRAPDSNFACTKARPGSNAPPPRRAPACGFGGRPHAPGGAPAFSWKIHIGMIFYILI